MDNRMAISDSPPLSSSPFYIKIRRDKRLGIQSRWAK
jgi:hypothetical protein